MKSALRLFKVMSSSEVLEAGTGNWLTLANSYLIDLLVRSSAYRLSWAAEKLMSIRMSSILS